MIAMVKGRKNISIVLQHSLRKDGRGWNSAHTEDFIFHRRQDPSYSLRKKKGGLQYINSTYVVTV